MQKVYTLDNYTLIEPVGTGASGHVWRAFSGNHYTALKILTNKKNLPAFKNEFEILRFFDHPNIIKVGESNLDPPIVHNDGYAVSGPYITLELAEYGSVFDCTKLVNVAKPRIGHLSMRSVRLMFHEVVSALKYVHSMGFAHNDIKPQNILVSSKFTIKLADFGNLTSKMGPDGTGVVRTGGTYGYRGPEVSHSTSYSAAKNDIHSLGALLYSMIFGFPMYDENRQILCELFYKSKPKFWNVAKSIFGDEIVTPDVIGIIDAMASYKPINRPSLEDLQKFKWYNGPVSTPEEFRAEILNRLAKNI